jgi:hypothetical protein
MSNEISESGRVEVTDPMHCLAVGEMFALGSILRELREQQTKFPMPGLAFAIAMLEARDAENRIGAIGRNLRFAATHGADIRTDMVKIAVEDGSVVLSWGEQPA